MHIMVCICLASDKTEYKFVLKYYRAYIWEYLDRHGLPSVLFCKLSCYVVTI